MFWTKQEKECISLAEQQSEIHTLTIETVKLTKFADCNELKFYQASA